jgi:3-dehydroquinate synthase
MKTLKVDLAERAYPIYIGTDLLQQSSLYEPAVAARKVLIVSDSNVAPLYLDRMRRSLAAYEIGELVLPAGEASKSLEVLNRVFDALLEGRFDRSTTVVALGGGVIGDIAGFAAACYQRGVPFIQVPTTLLAQVDSSVGGKTGVNHRLGKNMIGAFHQPRCVIADTSTLDTLSDRELRAGIAEVIKYGLIRDREFFDWLEQNIERLLERDSAALSFAIERSCRCKAALVADDERETGQRALLNLGHTFGHAIETALGYGEWLHGEAVGAGMCMAARLSARMALLSEPERERAQALIAMAGLPTRPPGAVTVRQFLDLMAVDKKVQDGRLRLVLLSAVGKALVTAEIDPLVLQDSLSEMCGG